MQVNTKFNSSNIEDDLEIADAYSVAMDEIKNFDLLQISNRMLDYRIRYF